MTQLVPPMIGEYFIVSKPEQERGERSVEGANLRCAALLKVCLISAASVSATDFESHSEEEGSGSYLSTFITHIMSVICNAHIFVCPHTFMVVSNIEALPCSVLGGFTAVHNEILNVLDDLLED